MRKSDGFWLFIGSGMLLLAAILIQAHFVARADLPLLRQKAAVVKNLGLTDLCLSTEARYTRHLSQSDWHAAFQSHPLALDHFPSGSVFAPPGTLKKSHD
ncbi:MAG: hypothetical protein KKD99_10180 [Proteobacteria bacterium]|nr:hypothetical protein [Pseudomonadota bacterium]MBU4355430.1 hypothetical protein [Pseudomonadota bacterium]MBU4448945.1 hypothetical protein [Pseudomonadota bacterium]MCG2770840.1 hypothetical protein [Desulfobacterales bacterium]